MRTPLGSSDTATDEGQYALIQVEDDGAGMDPLKLSSVLAGTTTNLHVGLRNVDVRLRQIYGSGHGLVIDTAPGAGTLITLRIPKFVPLPDAEIGAYATVLPGANVSGNVSVGEGVLLGADATVIQGVTIGRNTIVGAGATVVRDLPADCTAVGTPAVPLRR